MCYTVSDTSWLLHVVSWAVLCFRQRQPAFYCSFRRDMVECGRKGGVKMLDKKTYELLEKLYNVGSMDQDEVFRFVGHDDANKLESHSSALLHGKMIKVRDVSGVPDGAGGYIGAKRIYEIDLPGKAYVEGKRALAHDKRVENIRYWITTAIAISAWITAIVSIILQYR